MSGRVARQAVSMILFRFGAIGLGAIAQIFAARQLGPEKLGISGMALTVVAQGSLIVVFGADALLVRRYRVVESEEFRATLAQQAFTLRCFLTLVVAACLLLTLPWVWSHPSALLASVCVIPLIFLQSNQALWILQAKEEVPAQYAANAASAFVNACVIFLIVRQDSPAGIDMLAGLIGVAVAFSLSWYSACRGVPALRLRFADVTRMLWDCRWLFLSAVVTYAYTRFEQPLLGVLRSLDELGVYRSALQIVAGVQPIFSLIPLLVYPKLISWRSESIERLWKGQISLFWTAVPWVILAAVAIVVILPNIYGLIFGAQFLHARYPCVILLVSKLVVILNGFFGWGLWAAERDKTMLVIMSFVGAVSVSLGFWLIPKYGLLAAAGVNLLSELLVFFLTVLFMWRLSRLANGRQCEDG